MSKVLTDRYGEEEAQNIKNIEELIHYATTPLKSTVLVFTVFGTALVLGTGTKVH